MKTSLKKLTSVLLAVLMLISVFSVMSVSAADISTTATGVSTVTLRPGVAAKDNPVWFAWTWDDNGAEKWVYGQKSGNDYTFTSVLKNITFVRMPNDYSSKTEGDWEKKWNQTGDLVTVNGGIYEITGWGTDKLEGKWSTPSSSETTKPVTGKQYYLVGTINGVDFGIGDDYDKPTPYPIKAGGTITTTFKGDAYINIKDIANNEWFFTDGFPGMEATSAIFYNEKSHKFNPDDKDAKNKLYIPGNVEVKITLVDNGNDTLTLSYVKVGDTPTSATNPSGTTKPVTGKQYYLVGTINGVDFGIGNDYDKPTNYPIKAGETITTTFEGDAYINIKDIANNEWFFTDGFPGMEATSAIFYNEKSHKFNPDDKDAKNKLYIPGNVEVKITLVDSGNDTLTLSYVVDQEDTTVSETTEATETTTVSETTEATETTTASETTETTETPTASETTEATETTTVSETTESTETTTAPETSTATETSTSTEETTKATESTETTTTVETNPDEKQYTFYYLPSQASVDAGYTFKLNINDSIADAPEHWYNYSFTNTGKTMNGLPVYSVTFSANFEDANTVQYQVYNGSEWVSEIAKTPIKLTELNNKVVIDDGNGTIADLKYDAETTNPTTAEPTTVEPTTVAPTTAESTTVAPTTAEPTTVEPTTVEPTTAEPTTVEPTTAPVTNEPTTAPTTAAPKPKPTQPTVKPAKDLGPGTDEKVVDVTITNLKNDSDPKGSKFGLLKAKAAKTTKTSITVSWTKVKGAKKYIVYSNKCGKTKGKINAYKKIKTTTAKSIKLTKINGKKISKGTYYKFLIVAVNSKGKVVSTSKTIHVATKGGKVTNYKSIKLNASSKTLKKGKTFKVKVTSKTKQVKKASVKNHRSFKYESSNTKIATVSSKGKIKAKKKGTCYVYVYAQNGVYKRIKIKVK